MTHPGPEFEAALAALVNEAKLAFWRTHDDAGGETDAIAAHIAAAFTQCGWYDSGYFRHHQVWKDNRPVSPRPGCLPLLVLRSEG